jgi:formate dehydrogenase subunit gamma
MQAAAWVWPVELTPYRRSGGNKMFHLFGQTRMTALLVAIFVLFAGGLAQAQQKPSSVRPPVGAIQTEPGGSLPGRALGNISDSETWRKIRHDAAGRVSTANPNDSVLVRSQGEDFRNLRNNTLVQTGAWSLLGIFVLLALFFLARGRIQIEAGLSGRTVLRFNTLERFAHWLTAGSFVVLGLTGLNMLYGKAVLLPVIGSSAFAALMLAGKYSHNYLGFAFTIGVVLMVILWLRENIPSRVDIRWLAVGGGLFAKGVHPPAKKFNAGQKIIFWVVVITGLSLISTGFSLLFPFQIALFEGTFNFLNMFGFDLPSGLTPLQETQLALLWHAVVALVAIVIIIAHIYIGTVSMEGAIDAVTTGEVDENWAREHHSLWLAELRDTKDEGSSSD